MIKLTFVPRYSCPSAVHPPPEPISVRSFLRPHRRLRSIFLITPPHFHQSSSDVPCECLWHGYHHFSFSFLFFVIPLSIPPSSVIRFSFSFLTRRSWSTPLRTPSTIVSLQIWLSIFLLIDSLSFCKERDVSLVVADCWLPSAFFRTQFPSSFPMTQCCRPSSTPVFDYVRFPVMILSGIDPKLYLSYA